MQTNVTRRNALKTGGLAAIVAGLAGAAGTPASAAEVPAAAPDLIAVLCTTSRQSDEDWGRWLAEWHQERQALSAKHDAIIDALGAYVPADRLHDLVGKLSDIAGDKACHESDRERELVLRHMPGLEPVLRMVWMHAMGTYFGQEGECGQGHCMDGLS